MSFWPIMYRKILALDRVGPQPKLNHLGMHRYATTVGVLLTIGQLIFAIYINFNYLRDAFYNYRPFIFITKQPHLAPQWLTKHSFKFYFQIKYIQKETNGYISINRTDYPKIEIFGITYNSTQYKQTFLNSTNEPVFFEFCNAGKIDVFEAYNDGMIFKSEKFTEKEIAHFRNTSLCFPDGISEKLSLITGGAKTVATSIIYPDFKALSVKYKSPISIVFHYQKVLLDPENADNPFRLVWTESSFVVQPDRSKQIRIYIETYDGTKDLTKFIYGQNFKRTIEYLSAIEQIMDLKNTHDYPPEIQRLYDVNYWFLFEKSPQIVKALVKYKSYDMFLSKLGGILKVFSPIMNLISSFFIAPFFQVSRINNIFNFHENDLSSCTDKQELINVNTLKNNELSMKNCEINHKKKPPSLSLSVNHINSNDNNNEYLILQNENKNNDSLLINSVNIRRPEQDNSIELNEVKESENKGVKNIPDKLPDIASNQEIVFDHTEVINKENRSVNLDHKTSRLSSFTDKNPLKELSEYLQTRKSISVNIFDFLQYKYCCCESRKRSIILNSMCFIRESLDEINLTKELMELKMIKKLYFKLYKNKKYLIPSVNVNYEESQLFNFYLKKDRNEEVMKALEENKMPFDEKSVNYKYNGENLDLADISLQVEKKLYENYLRSIL